MPVAGVVGVRFALEPGQGRTSVPVRSALLGTILAVVVLVATLTFASGLNTLASSPALYGWNWNYALNPSNDVPPAALTLLNHDSDVAAWSGVDYNNFEIDGESVPVLFGRPGAAVTPPILSGHGLDANDQIVIGSSTLAVLHKHVGDTVELSYETPADAPIYLPPTPLKIVGTATFPAVGYASFIADHTSMGTGALFSKGVFSSALPAGRRRNQRPESERPGAGIRETPKRSQCRGGPGQSGTHRRRGEQDLRQRPRCRRQQRRRYWGAASRADRELPEHRRDPGHPRRRARPRGDRRPRAHARRIGPPPPTRPGPVEGSRLHSSTAGRRGRVAIDGYRSRRRHRGRPARDRPRAPTVDGCSPATSTLYPTPPCRSSP